MFCVCDICDAVTFKVRKTIIVGLRWSAEDFFFISFL